MERNKYSSVGISKNTKERLIKYLEPKGITLTFFIEKVVNAALDKAEKQN